VANGDPHSELLKKKGIEHERRYLDYLKSQGKQITIIDPHDALIALRSSGAPKVPLHPVGNLRQISAPPRAARMRRNINYLMK
jgi:hypothetical protein